MLKEKGHKKKTFTVFFVLFRIPPFQGKDFTVLLSQTICVEGGLRNLQLVSRKSTRGEGEGGHHSEVQGEVRMDLVGIYFGAFFNVYILRPDD